MKQSHNKSPFFVHCHPDAGRIPAVINISRDASFLSMTKASFLLLSFFQCLRPAFSQNIDSTSLGNKSGITKAYIKSYFVDIKDIAISPFNADRKQWLQATVVLGSVALISTQDIAIRDFFQRNRNTTTNDLAKYVFEPIGSGAYSIPILGAIYLQGLWSGNNKSKAVAMMGVKTYAITGLYAQIVKHIVHRHRPFQVYGDDISKGLPPSQYRLDGPFKGFSYTSFPSGHTISAFSMATIITQTYKDTPCIPLLSYILATGTGLSRINDDKHWASDVLMGAALGTAMGMLIYKENNWGIKVLPYQQGSAAGLSLQMAVK